MGSIYEIKPVGHVESPLVDPTSASKQGFEGAPQAWLVFDPGLGQRFVTSAKATSCSC
jgi:hypothetical protein